MSVDVNGGAWLTHPLSWIIVPFVTFAFVGWLCREPIGEMWGEWRAARKQARFERHLKRLGPVSLERRLRAGGR